MEGFPFMALKTWYSLLPVLYSVQLCSALERDRDRVNPSSVNYQNTAQLVRKIGVIFKNCSFENNLFLLQLFLISLSMSMSNIFPGQK